MILEKRVSLYFNARLIGAQLVKIDRNSVYATPVMYPFISKDHNFNQYEVLIETIKSYSKIKFNIAIFNIDIGDFNSGDYADIEKIILSFIDAKLIKVNFQRPSNARQWIESFNNAKVLIGDNQPTIVAMNHDHLFLDHNDKYLNFIVNNIFDSNDDFGKLVLYSHFPESISDALNSSNFSSFKNYFKKDCKSSNKPPLFIMTLETLGNYLPIDISDDSYYIGRLMDWVYSRGEVFNVLLYVPLRELFKHYDGYGHVTTSNLISDLRQFNNMDVSSISNLESLIKYYYQKWLDINYIFLRDSLNGFNPLKSNKILLRDAIDRSFDLFKDNYIEFDSIIIDGFDSANVSELVYNYIYFNFLAIYKEIYCENLLMKRSLIIKFSDKIKNLYNNLMA